MYFFSQVQILSPTTFLVATTGSAQQIVATQSRIADESVYANFVDDAERTTATSFSATPLFLIQIALIST